MLIDDVYDEVIKNLTEQSKIEYVSSNLLSLRDNNERVLYVHQVLNDLNVFPHITKVEKSDSVSIYYRNQGNKCFQSSEDFQAWQYYNLALLHSPTTSSNYYLALSNRSAVFYSMKKYNECINDINTASLHEIPKELSIKLNKRREMCYNALQNMENTITQESNKILNQKNFNKDSRYLCASTKLEVKCTEEMGRHVIAKENISVGEVLAVEYPYFNLLLKAQYLFSCSYCLSRNLNLFPCESCCYSLYCSNECKENAFKSYHATECSLLATLFDMDFTKLELLALRTVLKARNDHNDWESFFKTIEDAEANLGNEFRGHIKKDGKWIFDSTHYAAIHTLESNIDKRSVSDIFQKAVTAAVFYKLVLDHTTFLQEDDAMLGEEIRNCFAGLLLLHLMTSPTNMHGIGANIVAPDGTCLEEESLASAPYAFHSLLNHSCAPNVVRNTKLGTSRMTLIALRPIKKGMQIFDNYGPHHALDYCMSRQSTLKSQYKFQCVCEACVNNWPTYLCMRPSTVIPTKLLSVKNKFLAASVIDQLQRGDKAAAEKMFKPLCSLCTHLDPYAPCMELSDCQEALKQCFEIFAGILPLGNKLMIPWTVIPPEV